MPIFKHITPKSIPYSRDGDIAKVSFPMPKGKLRYLPTEIKDLIEWDILNGYVGETREAKFDTEKLDRVYDRNCHFKFRYVVNTKNQIFFALEGVPRTNAVSPAHYQLVSDSKDSARCYTAGSDSKDSARCYTAGNVIIESFVDENGQHTNPKIIKINHKSGDFEPDFDSMQIALMLLFQTPELFADELYIEKLTSAGGFVSREPYSVRLIKEEIDACVLVFPEPIDSPDPLSTPPRLTQQSRVCAPYFTPVDAQPAAATSDIVADMSVTEKTVLSHITRVLSPAKDASAPSPKRLPLMSSLPLWLTAQKATSGTLTGTPPIAKEDTSKALPGAGTLGRLGTFGSSGKR